MFGVNKASRTFLQDNYNSIQNGFINEGLITYDLEINFRDFEQLERLYFEALKRNHCNRKITLNFRK